MKDTETNSVPLNHVVVILNDSLGNRIAGAYTDTTGHYEFNVPPGNYRLYPSPDRQQVPMPDQKIANNGAQFDFKMMGIPAHIVVPNIAPTTYVAITTFTWTAPQAPTWNAGAHTRSWVGMGGYDRQWIGKVPKGDDYWMTCWTMDDHYIYHKSASIEIGAVKAQDERTVECP